MLSNRLNSVVKHINPDSIVVDVGTDHALLPIYLISSNLTSRVIGIEIKEKTFLKAVKSVEKYGLGDRIQILLGDGLEPVKHTKVDIVVICGIGGKTIMNILKRGMPFLKNVPKLILQPMNGVVDLRHFLLTHGWTLVDEELVMDAGRLYEILVTEPGQSQELEDLLVEVGPILYQKKHPLLPMLIQGKIKRYAHIANSLEKSGNAAARERINYYLAKVSFLERMLVSCL
ncbi:MAG: class I SAM-dependent methyltransferase [Bacillota bacterium]